MDAAKLLDLEPERVEGMARAYEGAATTAPPDASEPPRGEPLFVKLVENGRIIYRESFEAQADRADRTWGRYQRWELSPKVSAVMERYRTMRAQEIEAAKRRLKNT